MDSTRHHSFCMIHLLQVSLHKFDKNTYPYDDLADDDADEEVKQATKKMEEQIKKQLQDAGLQFSGI